MQIPISESRIHGYINLARNKSVRTAFYIGKWTKKIEVDIGRKRE